MALRAKLRKALALARRRRFASAAAWHRIAAAIEHLAPIRHAAAATLIDVGANKGQFSLAYRELFPRGRIIAFEPLPDAAARFDRLFAGDLCAELHRVALSDHAGEAEFHVTDRRDSSSLLRPTRGQADAFGVREAELTRVPLRRLDQCVAKDRLVSPVLIKIDVQGAELQVLRGCDWLEAADSIYVELSFVELYEGQPLYEEVSAHLGSRGFTLAGIFNQAMTAHFGPTQADFLFKKTLTG